MFIDFDGLLINTRFIETIDKGKKFIEAWPTGNGVDPFTWGFDSEEECSKKYNELKSLLLINNSDVLS